MHDTLEKFLVILHQREGGVFWDFFHKVICDKKLSVLIDGGRVADPDPGVLVGSDMNIRF